ncbi:MAG: type 1 glutamine amidotransferase [Nevskiales bacterium]
MRVHWLQHAEHEGLGSIEPWLMTRGHVITRTSFPRGESLPGPDEFDWLIVMGGPMNIYEEARYPWLKDEKRLIKAAIDAGKRVLGICLGSQLIADQLGGRVTRNTHTEIGWFPVRREAGAAQSALVADWPAELEVFHWHGDTFALPPGALHLASSAGCRNQGFQHGARVLGLQFHLEITPADITEWLRQPDNGELKPASFVQQPAALQADGGRFARLNQRMAEVMEKLAAA